MDLQIMLQSQHFKHGVDAALRGDDQNTHGLHWDSLALRDWLRGYNSTRAQQHGQVAEP